MRSKADIPMVRSARKLGRPIFLVDATGDDFERDIRQRTLQQLRLIPWRAHPHVAFFLGDQDHI